MLSINKAVYEEDTSCYMDYVRQVSKWQHVYVIGLKWIFFKKKFKWKVLKKINPNCAGLSRGSFLTLAPMRLLVWKPYFIWLRIQILHLVHTTSLTDLCFNKKFEQEKKSLYKSIPKSIHIDTSQLTFT